MKRMLINATQAEEVRVALVDGQKLHDLDIENREREQKKASIYKARITRVEPSLEAAFVEFGSERHGFLPLKEISRQYFRKKPTEMSKLDIKELVAEGTEVIVQVDKEERGTKGAALTTFVSLAGRYMVLMPNNPRAGGISRRIEGEDRDQLRAAMSELDIPQGMGVIVRTAGVGRTAEELQWDLNYLLQLWEAIGNAVDNEPNPSLLYQENNVVLRAIRDNLRKDVGEVLIDSPEAYQEASGFISQVMPHYASKVKLYEDDIPLFSRYQVESQIETAFQRNVRLPSGGSLVIDPTEALVSIDINSARATKGADIEETALNTNLEAAEEVARQLRLRDMGGLIVIDFIDMSAQKNQRAVENRLRESLQIDRARVQVGRISRFGLMEMSRQRLRPSLEEMTSTVCPRCSGQGSIRDTRPLALAILRVVEEECLKERSSLVRAMVPLSIASFLLNEKRREVNEIEQRTATRVQIIPNVNMETPAYEVQRLRDDQAQQEPDVPSYELADVTPTVEIPQTEAPRSTTSQQAAVRAPEPVAPAPVPQSAAAPEPATVAAPDAAAAATAIAAGAAASVAAASTTERPGLFKRLVTSLFSDEPAAAPAPTGSEPAATEAAEATPAPAPAGNRDGDSTGRGGSGERRRRSRGGRGRNRGGRGRSDGNRNRDAGDAPARSESAQGDSPQRSASDDRDGAPREHSARNAQDGDGEQRGNRRSRRGGRRRNRRDEGDRSGNERAEATEQNADDAGRREPRSERPAGGRSEGRGRARNPEADAVIEARNAIDPQSRQPSAEALAESKRQPVRDRAALAEAAAASAAGAGATAARKASAAQDAPASEPAASQPAESSAETTPAVATVTDAEGTTPTIPSDRTAMAQESDAASASSAAGTPPGDEPQATATSAPASTAAPIVEAAATVDTAEEAEAAAEAPVAEAPVAEAPATDASEVNAAAAETVDEAPAAQEPAPEEPARAYNDPREVRRRRREAELKAQGVLPKG
ncbi:MAG: Rne/Rng family ribonuclease [Pseudomonadota bacterium]